MKIDLSTFSEVSTFTLGPAVVFQPISAVIDTANGYAYFGLCTDSPYSPYGLGGVLKVYLPNFGEFGPNWIEYFDQEVNNPDGCPASAVIDTANQMAYFGTTQNLMLPQSAD